MSSQLQIEQTDVSQFCEHIFRKGEYLPCTVAESELLQSYGFELKGSALVLPSGIERLNQDCIGRGLDECGEISYLQRVQVNVCVGSTNQALLTESLADDISGRVVLAELQTSGRGRFGRNWISPVGRNLAISLGATLSRTPNNVGAISLVVGVAVANTIQELGIDVVKLKWPNDILLDGRKVGGILVDLVNATSPFKFIVGVGLNVGAGPVVGKVVDCPVADLLDYHAPPIRNKLAVSITRNVYDSIRRFELDGFQSFLQRWRELDALQNNAVTISTPHETIRGIAHSVKHTGELCVELHDGRIHHVNAGDVSLDYTQ